MLAATELSTAFTYQGRLAESDNPADGAFDLRFIMYDAESGGSQVGETVTKEDVSVTGGLFSVELDFGAPPLTVMRGGSKWRYAQATRPIASTC